MSTSRHWLVSCSLAALVAASPSQAQEAGVPSAAPVARPAETQLEDIVVTAQKRSENLQDVPIAVTAITSAKLESSGVVNALSLSTLAPGLNIVGASGFVKPFVRGVGSNVQGAGAETSVSIYVDGVYYASSAASLFTFNDVERVEVLKGPQGTLFGRNATGGLIHIITKDPGRALEGKLDASYGNYETVHAGGYIGGGLFDGVRASFAAQYTHQGKGFGINYFNGDEINIVHHDVSLRGKLIIDLGSDTSLRLAADYLNRDAPTFPFRAPLGYKPTNMPSDTNPAPRAWDGYTNVVSVNRIEVGGGSARLEHDFGWAQFLSISALRRGKTHYEADNDASPASITALDVTIFDRQFTQEAQVQAPRSSKVQWVIGGFYLDSAARTAPLTTLFGGPAAPLPTSAAVRSTRAVFGTTSIAGFAQASVEVLPKTKVTAGLRYTKETRDADYVISTRLNNGVNTTAAAHPTLEYRRLTWRAAIDHKFSPDILGYVSYNRGFKAGGFNPSAPNAPAYLPESLDAYEVGLKTELADRRIRLNIASFYYDYKNLQVSTVALNGSLQLSNGAAARLYGLDAELNAVVSKNFTLDAGVGLLNGRFNSFPNGSRYDPNPSGGFILRSGIDLSGNHTPNGPSGTFNLGGDLHVDAGRGEAGLNLTYFYNSGFFSEPDNTLRQPAYHMINATLRWVLPDGRLSVQLWGRNLADEVVVNQLSAGAVNGLASYQAPRTFGVTVGTRF